VDFIDPLLVRGGLELRRRLPAENAKIFKMSAKLQWKLQNAIYQDFCSFDFSHD
jgi:hypothetical protein